MGKAEDVQAEKDAYEAYRDRAIAATKDTNVQVAHGASVYVVEDGAFVEAVLWVPKET